MLIGEDVAYGSRRPGPALSRRDAFRRQYRLYLAQALTFDGVEVENATDNLCLFLDKQDSAGFRPLRRVPAGYVLMGDNPQAVGRQGDRKQAFFGLAELAARRAFPDL